VGKAEEAYRPSLPQKYRGIKSFEAGAEAVTRLFQNRKKIREDKFSNAGEGTSSGAGRSFSWQKMKLQGLPGNPLLNKTSFILLFIFDKMRGAG
jgi:hypothetical protein